MNYYINSTPTKAINALHQYVKPDMEWANENLSLLSFFKGYIQRQPFSIMNIFLPCQMTYNVIYWILLNLTFLK